MTPSIKLNNRAYSSLMSHSSQEEKHYEDALKCFYFALLELSSSPSTASSRSTISRSNATHENAEDLHEITSKPTSAQSTTTSSCTTSTTIKNANSQHENGGRLDKERHSPDQDYSNSADAVAIPPRSHIRTLSDVSYYPKSSLYDEGMLTFTRPLSIHPQECGDNNTTIVEATINFNIGHVHTRMRDDEEALQWFSNALQLIKNYQYLDKDKRMNLKTFTAPKLQTYILSNISHIHWRAETFDVAIFNYSKALDCIKSTLQYFIRLRPTALYNSYVEQKIKETKLYMSATLNCMAVSRFYSRDEDKFPARETLSFLHAALRIADEASTTTSTAGYRENNETGERDSMSSTTTSMPFSCQCRGMATLMNNMGRVMFDTGDYTHALATYKVTSRHRMAILGDGHIDVGVTFYNIAETEKRLGEFKQAIDAYKKFLTIAVKELGTDHNDVINAFLTLGQLHTSMEQYIESIHFLTMALKSAKRVFGMNNRTVSFILNQLGNSTFSAGHLDSALKFYEVGLSVERNLVEEPKEKGGGNELLLVTLSNIANVAKLQEKYDLALEHYTKSLQLIFAGNKEEKDDEKHHEEELANILLNVAFIKEQQGDCSVAANRLKEAMEIWKKLFGTQSFPVSSALNALGLVQMRQGEKELALVSFAETHNIRCSDPQCTPKTYRQLRITLQQYTSSWETLTKPCTFTKKH